jgi:O-glycosyl hydrolase
MKYIQRNALRVETSQLELTTFGHVAFVNPDGQVVFVAANAHRNPQRFAVQCGDQMFEDELPGESVATYLYYATPDQFEETRP